MIRRDADARAGDIATLRPTDLIERTTGGIRWLAEPGIRRVILAPSYFARPYNFVLGGRRLADVRLPDRRRRARRRPTRSHRRRRSSGSTGRSATRPDCGSSACWRDATTT